MWTLRLAVFALTITSAKSSACANNCTTSDDPDCTDNCDSEARDKCTSEGKHPSE